MLKSFVDTKRYRELVILTALYDHLQLVDMIKRYPATKKLAKALIDAFDKSKLVSMQ